MISVSSRIENIVGKGENAGIGLMDNVRGSNLYEP